MKSNLRPLLITCLTAALIQGCAATVVGGAAIGASALHDRRSTGTVIDDETIELTALKRLYENTDLRQNTHINATSYNYVLLLTGEAPTEQLRSQVEASLRGIEGVRRVHNEIRIAGPSSLSARSSDTLLTSRVKVELFKIRDLPGFDPTRVKVVSEAGTVFLMGLLRPSEAEAVVNTVRRVGGVQRVVKIFEYLS